VKVTKSSSHLVGEGERRGNVGDFGGNCLPGGGRKEEGSGGDLV